MEVELPTGDAARAQLTRAEADELELSRGDVVYVRPPGMDARRTGPTDAEQSEAPPLTA